jgi:uncharacterized protein
MRPPAPDPRRLDISAAARASLALEGQWPLEGFDRLCEGQPQPAGTVTWSARMKLRPVHGAEPELQLELHASAEVERLCQRCLQPLCLAVAVDRHFVFVRGEDRAAELDAEREDEDVLELTASLDLHDLVEDELLLALPLVPRHDRCPQPLPMSIGEDGEGEDRPHPFAALAALKRSAPH